MGIQNKTINFSANYGKSERNKKIFEYSKKNENEIINQIQSSDLDMEKNNFLQLNFESMIKRTESYRDTLNMQVEFYLETKHINHLIKKL